MLIIFLIVLLIILLNTKTKFIYSNIFVVSFAHNCCEVSQKNLEKSAYKYGAYKVLSLNLDTLEAPDDVKECVRNNKRIAGFGLWKPYAIKQIQKIANKHDIIIYVDSATYFNKSFETIVSYILKYQILCFKHGPGGDVSTLQSIWTKMNAVKYFNYPEKWCNTEGTKDQFISAFLGFVNNDFTKLLIDEWITAMNPSNLKLFDDSVSDIPNCPGFKESRHDQQMLSLILYKYYSDIANNLPDYNKNEYGWVWHENINGNDRHV